MVSPMTGLFGATALPVLDGDAQAMEGRRVVDPGRSVLFGLGFIQRGDLVLFLLAESAPGCSKCRGQWDHCEDSESRDKSSPSGGKANPFRRKSVTPSALASRSTDGLSPPVKIMTFA